MEIAKPLHYMSDDDGPTGRRRCQRRVASVGRRDAGWPRTKADYQRGIKTARSSTSLMSHRASVGREAQDRFAGTARQRQGGVLSLPLDEEAGKIVSFASSTTPPVASSSRALELTTTQSQTSHAETQPPESAQADTDTAPMTGICLADPQERQSQTSKDTRHSSTMARAGERSLSSLGLGWARPRNMPPPPRFAAPRGTTGLTGAKRPLTRALNTRDETSRLEDRRRDAPRRGATRHDDSRREEPPDDLGPPCRKNNTNRRRPRKARSSANRPHRPRVMQMDHTNAKETEEDACTNAALAPSPSSRTTLQKNQRCPRSARQ
eukprot:4807488-Pleurochrysis_carterae.AAC.2